MCDQEPEGSPPAYYCECQPDLFGDGMGADGCSSEAAVVRTSFKIGTAWDAYLLPRPSVDNWWRLNATAAAQVQEDFTAQFITNPDNNMPEWYFSYRLSGEGSERWISINVIVEDIAQAENVIAEWGTNNHTGNMLTRSLTTDHGVEIMGITLRMDVDLSIDRDSGSFNPDEINGDSCADEIELPNGYMAVEPRVYTWTAGTTDDPVFVLPTGMAVTNLYFKHDCLSAGCWVVEVDYTIGEKNFNVFYVPRVDNSDTLSYDYDYAGTDFDATFQPANHPCSLDAYVADDEPGIETAVSVCCIPAFVDKYRVMRNFVWDQEPSGCETEAYTGVLDYNTIVTACDEGAVDGNHPNAPIISTANMPPSALSGKFSNANTVEDMMYSHVKQMGVIDPYLGIYKATFYLDEIELRRSMGKLSGTVSVEHTVEFFVGLANFKPNDLQSGFLNPQVSQVNIIVEKTDFFTVATHGVNDYTFLRYTNMRLVETYLQDTDNTDDAPTDRFVRNDRAVKAQFVQVTFTLGEQYGIKPGFDPIPLDSVRVQRGNFLAEGTMHHACLDYTSGTYTDSRSGYDSMFPATPLESSYENPDNTVTVKENFEYIVGQSCGPTSQMCRNPQGTDGLEDQFVAFNVPVGFDFFPQPAQDLSANIFVHMVIQVENREAMKGAAANPSDQSTASNITKTTLSASIPVVEGGINIFCDSITAKTDLKDVAYSKIYVGSAESVDELSRLRIVGGPNSQMMTSSVLDPKPPAKIDTDSIESALMTLVVIGNSSYFTSANGMGLVVEDLFTIHIMEDDNWAMSTGGCSSPWSCPSTFKSLGSRVLTLLETAGEELYDSSNNLQVDGYPLNGAFQLEIERGTGRARLQTTWGLDMGKAWQGAAGGSAPCGFASTGTGLANGQFRATCIIRRDINNRVPGAYATELPNCASDTDCVATMPLTGSPLSPQGASVTGFMANIFGTNTFSTNLANSYSGLIRSAEKLNGVYRRAWWINPGYEWVLQPGQSAFTLSQKIVMFALVGLDENRAVGGRRRFTVSSQAGGGRRADATALKDNNRAAQYDLISTDMSPEAILATASGTKKEDAKRFNVKMMLSTADECKSADEIRESAQGTLKNMFLRYASDVKDVYILSVEVERAAGLQCNRRQLTRKLMSGSSATVSALVAFGSASPKLNREGFEQQSAIVSVAQDSTTSAAGRIEVDNEYENKNVNVGSGSGTSGSDDDSDSDGVPVALIAGVVGGVAGAGILGAIAFFVMKGKRSESAMKAEIPTAAQSDIENLKFQLQSDA